MPLEENPAAIGLLDRLERGEVDALVLLTGVGTRALVEALTPRCSIEDLTRLLAAIPLLVRGPKPVAALRAMGLKPALVAPEPNTWRELLSEIDRCLPVNGLRIAVQEYGRPSPELLSGLESRGATVLRIPVYRWALPLDTAPLEQAIERLVRRTVDVAVFTTAVQVDHLLRVADEVPGRADAVRRALREHVVVATIGPTAAEALAGEGIASDIVPEHPKLGFLAAAIAERARGALERKRPTTPP